MGAMLGYLFGSLILGPLPGVAEKGDGPIDFACDAMQVFTKPNRVLCNRNVIVRRGDMLLCCEEFEGHLDPDGGWERLVCLRKVRAQRGGEIMWANKATFIRSLSDLILTGDPRIRRAKSILRGERIVIDTKYDRALIEKPRGRMVSAGANPVPIVAFALEGELPKSCPIPPAPAR